MRGRHVIWAGLTACLPLPSVTSPSRAYGIRRLAKFARASSSACGLSAPPHCCPKGCIRIKARRRAAAAAAAHLPKLVHNPLPCRRHRLAKRHLQSGRGSVLTRNATAAWQQGPKSACTGRQRAGCCKGEPNQAACVRQTGKLCTQLTPCSNTDRSPGLSMDRGSTLQERSGTKEAKCYERRQGRHSRRQPWVNGAGAWQKPWLNLQLLRFIYVARWGPPRPPRAPCWPADVPTHLMTPARFRDPRITKVTTPCTTTLLTMPMASAAGCELGWLSARRRLEELQGDGCN